MSFTEQFDSRTDSVASAPPVEFIGASMRLATDECRHAGDVSDDNDVDDE